MRILFAAREYLPRVGGMQQSVQQLAQRVPDSSVFTLRDPDSKTARNVLARAVRRLTGLELVSRASIGQVAIARTASAAGARRVLDQVRPDAVVANAGAPHTHAFVAEVLRATSTSTVRCLYVRDVHAVGLVDVVDADLLIANCEHLGQLMRDRSDQAVHVIPSIIDLPPRSAGSGRHVLFINPVEDRGLSIALAVARLLPDVPFRFQESWRLQMPSWNALVRATSDLPNVEVHRSVPVGSVYDGARALLVPYLVPNRPRVVFEAMASSVPVVGTDSGGVGEAVGDAGLRVDVDANPTEWASAVQRAHQDTACHERLVRAGHDRLRAPDADPAQLATRFMDLLRSSGTGR